MSSTHLWSIEIQRRASGGSVDPEQMRQRMIIDDCGEESDQTSDYGLLLGLHCMSETDRWAALQQLPAAECERMLELIPLWQALQEMSDDEIVRLLGEMDE